MKTLQISFEEELLEQIDDLVLKSSLSRDDIVMDAVKHRLKESKIKSFEAAWIEKLKQHPDNPEDAEKWIPLQKWDES